jgi:hypothetical protein
MHMVKPKGFRESFVVTSNSDNGIENED